VTHWAEVTGVSAEWTWPADTSSDAEALRLSHYLRRAKVVPVGVVAHRPDGEVDVQVTLHVNASNVGGVGSQGNRRLDRDGLEVWLARQWTSVIRGTVGRLVRRWLSGNSPAYTAIVNFLAGEDTAVVASDPTFHSKFRTS
jgi:hypothetical protein